MHTCGRLIKNVFIFGGQPETVISNIVRYLKLNVCLTNEDIVKAGTPGDCMYFISTGTVAIISPSGREVRCFLFINHLFKCGYTNVNKYFKRKILRETDLNIHNLREKFSPGPGFEPGSPALRAGALTN